MAFYNIKICNDFIFKENILDLPEKPVHSFEQWTLLMFEWNVKQYKNDPTFLYQFFEPAILTVPVKNTHLKESNKEDFRFHSDLHIYIFLSHLNFFQFRESLHKHFQFEWRLLNGERTLLIMMTFKVEFSYKCLNRHKMGQSHLPPVTRSSKKCFHNAIVWVVVVSLETMEMAIWKTDLMKKHWNLLYVTAL